MCRTFHQQIKPRHWHPSRVHLCDYNHHSLEVQCYLPDAEILPLLCEWQHYRRRRRRRRRLRIVRECSVCIWELMDNCHYTHSLLTPLRQTGGLRLCVLLFIVMITMSILSWVCTHIWNYAERWIFIAHDYHRHASRTIESAIKFRFISPAICAHIAAQHFHECNNANVLNECVSGSVLARNCRNVSGLLNCQLQFAANILKPAAAVGLLRARGEV